MLGATVDWWVSSGASLGLVEATGTARVRADPIAPFSSHPSRRMVLDSLAVSFLYTLYLGCTRFIQHSLARSRVTTLDGFSLGRTQQLGLPARNL